MSAPERLVLQAEAVRRARVVDGVRVSGGDGLDALLRVPDGAAAELVDRLADHGRLLRDLERLLHPEMSASMPSVLDGSVDELLATASRLVDAAQALLSDAVASDAPLADRQRRALDELRRCDAVGLA